jgi:hypothetical protein
MTIEDIARVCHSVNRSLCRSFGDDSQLPWEQAAQWQRDSSMKGVAFRLANPHADESAQHEAWMADKLAAGWEYGPAKDAAAKTHPCLVPFEQLPAEQKAKDLLFCAVVDSLRSQLVAA